MSDAQDQSLSLDEGTLARIEKMTKVACEGAIGSLLLLIFGMALPLLGQTLASLTPTVAYVALAELLIAG